MKKKTVTPVVFVTGIGQTWSYLSGGDGYIWNLFPSRKDIMFKEFTAGDYAVLSKTVAKCFLKLKSNKVKINESELSSIISKLFYCCRVDDYGRLPFDVTNIICGPKSFDVLRKTDLLTGEECSDFEKSVLYRLYRDIPCKSLAGRIGEENMYCFNYTPFSDIYEDADNLREMLKAVIEDQKNKTGCKRVTLVPMSMGGSIVSAYIDKYYSDESGAVGEDYIEKIISIVGAWDGSDGLSDLITFNVDDSFIEKLPVLVGNKGAEFLKKFPENNVKSLFGVLFDTFVKTIILRNSAFTALVPKDRYDEVCEKLFEGSDDIRLNEVRRVSQIYNNAQNNLINRLKTLESKCKINTYFICGYNKFFGEDSRDFSFLSLFANSEKTNSDSVIQISSTAPGVKWVKRGEKFDTDEEKYISPDKSIDASESPFRDRIWFFENQYHELGPNNTSIALATDIALGEVKDINGKYPQFNRSRYVGGAEELIEKSKRICDEYSIPAKKKESIAEAVGKVEKMLGCVFNDPGKDRETVEELKKELDSILQ